MNKLCLAGKNDIAAKSLKYIVDTHLVPRENIVVIPNGGGVRVKNMLNFRETASDLGVSIITDETTLFDLQGLILISLEYDKLIHTKKYKNAKFFNIHFSKLPAYKGMYTSAWPILNGETESGVTLHEIDDGIDTGPIIDQIIVPIGREDTCRDLYFKYNAVGVELFKKNIKNILDGTFTSYPQRSDQASYYSKKSIDYSSIQIDFKKTAFEVKSQIRAFTFAEYQMPKLEEKTIYRCIISHTRSTSTPGQIIKSDEDESTVATVDFDVILKHKLS